MLPAYSFIVDILDMHQELSEMQFRDLVAPSLLHLEALSVSVGRKPGKTVYYRPPDQPDKYGCTGCSVRYIALHSLGRDRAVGLVHAFRSLVRLIEFEVPQLVVYSDFGKFEFET